LDDVVVLPSSTSACWDFNSGDSTRGGSEVNLCHKVGKLTSGRESGAYNALLCLCVTVEGDVFAWGWGGSQGTHGGDGLSSGGQLVRTVPYFQVYNAMLLG
jgi:hypothetical protein